MPKSLQRHDRFIPGSASIPSFHIKTIQPTTVAKKNPQKVRSVSGVGLSVLQHDSFSLASPAAYTARISEYNDDHAHVRIPPSFGAMARVSHMQHGRPIGRTWDRQLEMSPAQQEHDEGIEGGSDATENQEEYSSSIAGALGVSKTRVFQYNTLQSTRNNLHTYAGCDKEYMAKLAMPAMKKVCKKRVVSHIPYRILDAPGLRNDFYANLVAWSPRTGLIAVGLLDEVFVWTEHEGAAQIAIPSRYGEVTCLVFSCENMLAVAHRDGTIVFYDVALRRIAATYVHTEAPACFLCWFPKDPCQILVGDESGSVVHLEITWGNSVNTVINKLPTLKGHTQQICGKFN